MSETIKQAARAIRERYSSFDPISAKGIAQALANAGLLAEPRTKPTREEIAAALLAAWREFETNPRVPHLINHMADAVLALWPGRTEAAVREQIATDIEAARADGRAVGDAAFNDGLARAARIARGGTP